ncbi:phage tail tape measure protein [Aurantimonas sp. VKM B-3413]|uniref:phage tail tape measure protein n=1 Tax=Aurantimonas sp. VKM B-3413 TaxID=2779401 RepID=UPI001E50BE29|nr:phage tail tape measure protein [Aurantimonas sp. VKM B-3413]MCB8835923.1 phage tail tape measure protein [Aurantimonas sp. VKM B-3413]
MARLSSELVLSLTDRVSGPARRVEGSINRLKHDVSGMDRRMMASRRMTAEAVAGMGRAQRLALVSAAGYAAPIAAAFGAKEVVTAAADFQSSLTGIQKKAGLTEKATQKLGAEIKDLASSGELAVPMDEILGAYERGAAAGLPIEDLRQFAILSAKASDAFEMPAEAVGNFAAKLKTALGMTDKEVRQVFDLTNSLADAGISDEKDIVDFMDRAGASLKTLGLTKEETLSLGATLLNVGMQSEKSATMVGALTGNLLTIGKLSGKAKKTFERYMGPTEEFAKVVDEDANGALLTMLDRLKTLDKSQKMDFLTSFVGKEWADEMLRFVEASDEYRRNLKLAGDQSQWFGSLDKSYALKLDDFWSQWQILKNKIEAAAIDVGNFGMPGLVAGMEQARALIDDIRTGIKQVELNIDWSEVDGAKAAVGELIGNIGELLNIDGSQSDFNKTMKDIGTMISQAAGFVKGVSRELNDIAEFFDDPTGYMSKERPQSWYDERGIPHNPEFVKKRKEEAEAARAKSEEAHSKREQRGREASKAVYGDAFGEPGDIRYPPLDYPTAPPRTPGRMVLPDLTMPTEAPRGLRHDIPVPTPAPREATRPQVLPTPSPAPRESGLPLPRPASPSPLPSASAALPQTGIGLSPAQSEIRDIDQALGDLIEKKRQLQEGFRLAPTDGAIETMRQIGDAMERLMQRRNELEASPPARIDVDTSALDGASMKASATGAAMRTALSITASPVVDASSIRAARSEAQQLAAELRQIAGLARSASAAAASARADYSGLHANTTRAG